MFVRRRRRTFCAAPTRRRCAGRAMGRFMRPINLLASIRGFLFLALLLKCPPKCDICQEMSGYIFCLEDRALLCRKCDIVIHTENTFVSAHQRFLLTGVKVGLELTLPLASTSKLKPQSREKTLESKASSGPQRGFYKPGEFGLQFSVNRHGMEDFAPNKAPAHDGGFVSCGIPQWQLDDFMGMTGFVQNYRPGYMYNGSS